MSGLIVITGPAKEPVELDELKDHLRIGTTVMDEDANLHGLIRAARDWTEEFLNRSLVEQELELSLDAFPSGTDPIRPAFGPLVSVTTIKYDDDDGVEQTWSNTLYLVDTASVPGRITPAFDESYPTSRVQNNAVRVRYKAGYGKDVDDVPENIRRAVMMTAAHLYENREATAAVNLMEVPMGVKGLLWPSRVLSF